MNNYKNMSDEEIKEQLEWSDHHEFSYGYSIWAFEKIKQLKKQKDNVVEYCKKAIESLNWKKRDIMQILTPENGYLKADIEIEINKYKDLLRMLGEIDNE